MRMRAWFRGFRRRGAAEPDDAQRYVNWLAARMVARGWAEAEARAYASGLVGNRPKPRPDYDTKYKTKPMVYAPTPPPWKNES